MEALGSWYALWMGGRGACWVGGSVGEKEGRREERRKEGKKGVRGRTYLFSWSWLL